MVPIIIIHSQFDKRQKVAEKLLLQNNLSLNHPNLLWLEDEKLGIEQIRKIKQHLSLKPYQGSTQAVVIIQAESLSPEAQNALLKTLEEPAGEVLIILGVSSEDQLLPTIISRCHLQYLQKPKESSETLENPHQKKIEQLLTSSHEQRFQFIEKLEQKEQFLFALTAYFRHQLLEKSAGALLFHPRGGNLNFLQDLIEAERWAKQNVNIRAILEYLMLKMPQIKTE